VWKGKRKRESEITVGQWESPCTFSILVLIKTGSKSWGKKSKRGVQERGTAFWEKTSVLLGMVR